MKRDEGQLSLILPELPSVEKKAKSSEGLTLKAREFDEDLYEELRSARKEIAREQGVPEFMVLSNKVLERLCIYRPQSEEDALQIPGMGPAKVRDYFHEFAALLQG